MAGTQLTVSRHEIKMVISGPQQRVELWCRKLNQSANHIYSTGSLAYRFELLNMCVCVWCLSNQ